MHKSYCVFGQKNQLDEKSLHAEHLRSAAWKLRVARWESRKLGLMAQSLIYGPQHLWGSAAEAKLHQAALCHTGHT